MTCVGQLQKFNSPSLQQHPLLLFIFSIIRLLVDIVVVFLVSAIKINHCIHITIIMKYLDILSFHGINSLLDNLDMGDTIVSGSIEAYSCTAYHSFTLVLSLKRMVMQVRLWGQIEDCTKK